jgi:hypothetical protein
MERAIDNSLAQELDAMAAVGQILGTLTDPAARQRVLNWATERFASESETPSGASEFLPTPVSSALEVTDPALAVDSLDDMFAIVAGDVGGDAGLCGDFDLFDEAEPQASNEPKMPKLPIEVVVRSFAADFQRFTEEWNGATAS